MRIRLSTVLLLLLAVSVAIGWYVDRSRYVRKDIVGVWHSPTYDFPSPVIHESTLVIREDGTFTKSQRNRTHTDTFDGTYSDNGGVVVFHVKTKTTKIGGGHKYTSTDTIKTDRQYGIRCAIDPAGFLIVDNRSQAYDDEIGIRWETHSR